MDLHVSSWICMQSLFYCMSYYGAVRQDVTNVTFFSFFEGFPNCMQAPVMGNLG